MFGMIWDPQLTTEKSEMIICDPDTQEVIPEGTASLVGWIKATVRSIYPEKGDCTSPLLNAKWKAPEEAADIFHMQVRLGPLPRPC